MATLFDVTLDLARHVRGVTRFKVTNITGKTITSARMGNRLGEYLNGTVWVMTGESAGHFSKIKSAKDDHFVPEDESLSIAKDDYVMVCPWIDFDLDTLIEFIIRNWDKDSDWGKYDHAVAIQPHNPVYLLSDIEYGKMDTFIPDYTATP